jgi:signal transduction histidine kinase
VHLWVAPQNRAHRVREEGAGRSHRFRSAPPFGYRETARAGRRRSALLADVLANLLSNAFKFSARRDAPRVAGDCEVGPREVVYRVSDNGIGFKAEHSVH